MYWPEVEKTAVPLNVMLDRLTVHSLDDLRSAAQALHETALAMGNFRTAPCSNIASKDPMVDGKGAILATEVFGWNELSERWWDRPRLALTSPLTLACRYEKSSDVVPSFHENRSPGVFAGNRRAGALRR